MLCYVIVIIHYTTCRAAVLSFGLLPEMGNATLQVVKLDLMFALKPEDLR